MIQPVGQAWDHRHLRRPQPPVLRSLDEAVFSRRPDLSGGT
ncbi:hypothetical protein [Streptomyces sp. NPDC126503]